MLPISPDSFKSISDCFFCCCLHNEAIPHKDVLNVDYYGDGEGVADNVIEKEEKENFLGSPVTDAVTADAVEGG